MQENIQEYLSDIEQKYQIKILLACETGSRAWGFPSPDSDYDVRLIYKHPEAWYLSLKEEKDSIDIMLEDNEIDISGWDIRKSLRLLWKSNPPMLERIQSHIVYMADPTFTTEIQPVAANCYSPIATMYHYLSMARKGMDVIQPAVSYKLKKFFYTLRATLACLWIVEKNIMPPIYFPTMVNELPIPDSLKLRIEELIAIKAQVDENYLHNGEQELLLFIQDVIKMAEGKANNLPPGKGNFEELNWFFRQMLTQK